MGVIFVYNIFGQHSSELGQYELALISGFQFLFTQRDFGNPSFHSRFTRELSLCNQMSSHMRSNVWE
jgi:hypothetical protein